MNSNLIKKIVSVKKIDFEIKPIFFDLKSDSDQNKLSLLLEANSSIEILDEINGQLEELIKLKNPKKKFSVDELNQEIEKYLKDTPIQEYGVWVYYPWLNKIIHLLDEEEFIEVRTNRNQNKITNKEQRRLKTKKIGIIGLSVGQSVALTLALERVVGELNIADFDILELSNLNRIRTGVYNLNIPKTVAVAREIAEIDPFIKVNCFHEGITENNIDDFLLKDRKVDLLIDECDGLDIKVLCRLKAKEYGIPVVMDTSERGTMDIERFDLHPERSIFHGLIDHLDISKLKEAKTNEEKVPYILALIGWETISDKMKASMVEVEETITTWPQLASSVTMGGGMTCDVSRRILLNQYHDSGRYIIDIEELIKDKVGTDVHIEEIETTINDEFELTKETMMKMALKCSALKSNSDTSISEKLAKHLVSKAILAPTGGNSQPWKWLFTNNQLFLFQHKGKTNKFLDFKSYGTILGLGAATENLILEAQKNNINAKINLFPIDNNNHLVAQIYFTEINENNTYTYLADYIENRCTDRNIYHSEKIDEEVLKKLKTTCSSVYGAKLHFLTSEKDIKKYGEILGKSDKTLLTNKETHAEFMNEIRWDQKEVEQTKTGVDIETIDLTATEIAGFKMIKNWSVVKHLNRWGGGSAFEKLSKKCAESAYAIGLITIPKLSSEGFFNGGRALERVWLEASKNNLNIHPISGLTYVFTRLLHGDAENMNDKMIKTISKLREEHEELFKTEDEVEVFLFRIFKGNKPVKRSLRKEIKEVFMYA
jgi:molybdopterin/thiamine biosynthesis adenylyltransferase